MERANERHVLGLDLIRFAAAVMVMAFHYGHDIGPIPLSWAGWVGVEIFFVMSGYVIAASAEGAAPWDFARNRVVRLMPAVWLCSTAIVGLCLVQATYPDLGARYLRSIVLWPTGTWLDGVYWTLPVEVIFYAAVFLALLWRWPLGLVLRLIGAASAAYWMLRLAALVTPTPLPIVPDPVATLSLLGFGCYFALGGIMREAVTKGWTLERGAVAVVGIAAGLVQIAFAASNWSPGADLSWLPHAQKAAPAITWLVLSAMMIASARLNPLAWRWVGRAAPPIRLLGLATYPLYLLHDSIGNVLKAFPLARSPLPASLIAIGVSVAVAAWMEPLAQRTLRRLLSAGLPARRRTVVVDRTVG